MCVCMCLCVCVQDRCRKRAMSKPKRQISFFFLELEKGEFGRYFKAPLLVDALTLNITTFLIAMLNIVRPGVSRTSAVAHFC
jgi:hypothetical protein